MAARARGRLSVLAVVVVLAFIGAAAWGASKLWHTAQDTFSTAHCDVGPYSLDTDQASVAAQMVGEVSRFRRPLPGRVDVLVLMAALQESKLTNIPPGEGDRDSVGVLQQRPSQGWGGGSAARLTDVTEATREFVNALLKVPGWRHMTPAAAIQAVQISADGSAYAQHEPEARVLAAALTGRKPEGISCAFDAPTAVATPGKVAALLRAQLPVHTARPVGRTVRVSGARNASAAWQTAAWFVANADRLGIDTVTYRDKRWSRGDGWAADRGSDPAASRSAVVAAMAQL